MGTKLRRVMLSMPDDLDELMARLASVSKTPKSTAIIAMLREAQPMIEAALHYLEKIQHDKDKILAFKKQAAIDSYNEFAHALDQKNLEFDADRQDRSENA